MPATTFAVGGFTNMTDDDAWYEMMGQLEATQEYSERKIGRPSYSGNAVVLPDTDPLIQEWNRWRELYE